MSLSQDFFFVGAVHRQVGAIVKIYSRPGYFIHVFIFDEAPSTRQTLSRHRPRFKVRLERLLEYWHCANLNVVDSEFKFKSKLEFT